MEEKISSQTKSWPDEGLEIFLKLQLAYSCQREETFALRVFSNGGFDSSDAQLIEPPVGVAKPKESNRINEEYLSWEYRNIERSFIAEMARLNLWVIIDRGDDIELEFIRANDLIHFLDMDIKIEWWPAHFDSLSESNSWVRWNLTLNFN